MKTVTGNRDWRKQAFTRQELVIVVGLVGFLFILILSALSPTRYGSRSRRIQCVSNLKQIGLANRIIAHENGGKYPFSITNSFEPYTGTPLYQNLTNAHVWMHFQMLSNELSSPKMLICPADRSRVGNVAKDFTNGNESLSAVTKRDQSVSYFIGPGADEATPQMILNGDRNLSPSPNQPGYSSKGRGAVTVLTNSVWYGGSAGRFHPAGGNVAIADGSVRVVVTDGELQELLKQAVGSYGTNANTFLFPQ